MHTKIFEVKLLNKNLHILGKKKRKKVNILDLQEEQVTQN